MNSLRGIITALIIAILCFGSAAAEDIYHVVGRGDTIFSISRTYKVSQEELMRVNSISDASKLQVGMRLRIPGGSPAPEAQYSEHVVVRNDTLFGIARANGITLQELLNLNGFSSNHVIKVGDKIRIPASSTRTAQVLTTPPALSGDSSGVDPSVRWPVKAKSVSYMTGKLYCVLVEGERSESVRSLTHGIVRSAQPFQGYGKLAIVEVSGGYLYVYGGCESLSVKEGDEIGPGTELGKLGVSDKPLLFFMVYRNNVPIDPAKAPRA